MKRIELKVQDVTQGTMGGKPYFLMLREAEGNRKLSIMVGAAEAQAILVTMRGVPVPRPLVYDVFVSTLEAFDITLREVLIYKVVDGVYYSSLVMELNGCLEHIDTRTSDAIALALRYHAPIYTIETLMAREHIFEDGNGAISIPVSSVGMEVLKEALDRAVKEENYELAAQIRDEIARRKHEGREE